MSEVATLPKARPQARKAGVAAAAAVMLALGVLSILFAISEWEFKASVANALFPLVTILAAFIVPRSVHGTSTGRSTGLEWACVPAVIGSSLLLFTAMIQFGLGDLPSPISYALGARPRLIDSVRAPDGRHEASAWVMPLTRQTSLQVHVATEGVPLFDRNIYWKPLSGQPGAPALRWEDDHTLTVVSSNARIDLDSSAFHLPLIIELPGQWLRGVSQLR